MWFLLFSFGAILVSLGGIPWAQRLPWPPPGEAVLAAYFLVVALLRLWIRDARLAAFERKARRLARRRADAEPPGAAAAAHLGRGVGLGAIQAVGGDFIMAGLTLLAALFRGAAATMARRDAPPPPSRERRRAVLRERVRAGLSIVAIGLVCAALAWAPLFRARVQRAVTAAATAAGFRW